MKYFELVIKNDIRELSAVQESIDKISNSWDLDPKVGMQLNLVLEEVITNIIFYGYRDDDEHKIMLGFTRGEGELTIEISDDGVEFDITRVENFDDTGKSAEDRKIGGLGIHFVKSMMDDIEYRRAEGKNILILKKKI
jgi:anti-sigma regulatory factor (Ser/Thr protein kinase)